MNTVLSPELTIGLVLRKGIKGHYQYLLAPSGAQQEQFELPVMSAVSDVSPSEWCRVAAAQLGATVSEPFTVVTVHRQHTVSTGPSVTLYLGFTVQNLNPPLGSPLRWIDSADVLGSVAPGIRSVFQALMRGMGYVEVVAEE